MLCFFGCSAWPTLVIMLYWSHCLLYLLYFPATCCALLTNSLSGLIQCVVVMTVHVCFMEKKSQCNHLTHNGLMRGILRCCDSIFTQPVNSLELIHIIQEDTNYKHNMKKVKEMPVCAHLSIKINLFLIEFVLAVTYCTL